MYREANGPREKQHALTQYFTSLVGTTNNKAGLPDWIFKTWSVEEMTKLPALSITLLRTAVLKLGINKSSHEDAIIGEFFKEMDGYHQGINQCVKQADGFLNNMKGCLEGNNACPKIIHTNHNIY